MYGTWWKAFTDLAMLSLEAHGVITQRVAIFVMGGPGAHLEAQRMVSEKVFAAGEAAIEIATGASNADVIRGYRHKIRANARRLRKA